VATSASLSENAIIFCTLYFVTSLPLSSCFLILMDLKENTLKTKNNKNNLKKVDFKRKRA
jgi:hypothetical protein